jgi:hypothetical protein
MIEATNTGLDDGFHCKYFLCLSSHTFSDCAVASSAKACREDGVVFSKVSGGKHLCFRRIIGG